jgi:iron complex outermembrane receptor protein
MSCHFLGVDLKKNIRKHLLSAGFVACLSLFSFSSTASAQMIDYKSFQELFGEPVTTSATGKPQRLSDVPLNMEIITQDDIRKSGAKQIPDILRNISGVNVRQITETQIEVGIRGYNGAYNDRVLVLVNGRQVYLDYYGLVNWELIPVQLKEIQQIEVIKGPNTALFGFNAVGGVVNIVTFNPIYDDINYIETYVGSQNSRGASLVQTMNLGDIGAIRYSLGTYRNDHFDRLPPGTVTADLATPVGDVQQDTDSIIGSVSGVFQVADSTQLELEYTAAESNRNEGVTIFYWNNEYRSRSYKANLVHETQGLGLWEADFYQNKVSAEPLGLDYNNLWVGSLSNIFKLGTDHTFRFMGEYRYNTANAFGAVGTASKTRLKYDVITGSGMWNWDISPKWTFNNALRFDSLTYETKNPSLYPAFNYDRDVEEISVNSGLVYQHDPNNTFRLSYARGIDIPSFIEYGVQAAQFQPNPQTPVSIIENVDFNFEHKFADLNTDLKVSTFYQKTDDYQTLVEVVFGQWTVANGGSSEVMGGEIELTGTFWDEKMHWGLNYSYADIEETLAPGINLLSATLPLGVISQNALYPTHMANAWLGYEDDRWEVDGYLTYYSDYIEQHYLFPTTAIPVNIEDLYLLSGRVAYKFNDQYTVALSGKNLNGDHYQAALQELQPQYYLTLTANTDGWWSPTKAQLDGSRQP